MVACPRCARQVPSDANFCQFCGAAIQATPQPPAAVPPPSMTPPPVYQPYAPPGAQAPPGYAPYPYPPYPTYKMPGEKEPVLSLILSVIFVGLGQIYNGRIEKGILFIIVGAAIIFLGIVLSILTLGLIWLLFGPLLFALWVFNIYDAYTDATRYNQVLRSTGRPPW